MSTPEPVPANDSHEESDTILGPGVPDICIDGWTAVTVTPCGAANPTPAEACAVPEYRAYLPICANYPMTQPAPKFVLPSTGPTSAPIAGGALLAVTAGLCLLRVSRRRATI
jgi:hypothetical protein